MYPTSVDYLLLWAFVFLLFKMVEKFGCIKEVKKIATKAF